MCSSGRFDRARDQVAGGVVDPVGELDASQRVAFEPWEVTVDPAFVEACLDHFGASLSGLQMCCL
jgi:hypothetical protein